MKFCYIDESGTGNEPVIVVAGVVVDAIRMHVTKDDWDDLIKDLRDISNGRVEELKAGSLFRGNAYWRQWPQQDRQALIRDILEWMKVRKHRVTFGAIDKARFKSALTEWKLPALSGCSDWTLAALHLVLTLQKSHQREKQNKGKTVFVFDDARSVEELRTVLAQPPADLDGFYARDRKQRPLDQLIDTPYTADSKLVGLLQVADLFAYLLRLYGELVDGLVTEKFAGETRELEQWVGEMRGILLEDAARWPSNSKDPCVQLYRELAPPSLLKVAA